MNILIANMSDFNPSKGGIERISNDLADELYYRRHKVFFLSCKRWEKEINYYIRHEQLLLDSTDFSDEKLIYKFKNYIYENNINIVLNQCGTSIEFTKFCNEACEGKIPLLTALHMSPVLQLDVLKNESINLSMKKISLKLIVRSFLKPVIFKKVKKDIINRNNYLCEMSEKIILLSNNFKEDFYNFCDEKYINKVEAISNFTNIERLNLVKKENIILFVGRLEYECKRPDRIVKIWKRIYKKYPDWKLKIIGNGECKTQLEEYVEKNKIKNIEFVGQVDSKREYENASILCMTSSSEGFGLVLIEAAINGCVPMAFESSSGLKDIIETGKNGILVKSFDIDEYKKQLEKLMCDDIYRLELSENALTINEKFNKDIIVDEWIKILQDCINKIIT